MTAIAVYGVAEDGGDRELLTCSERVACQASDLAERGGEHERDCSRADPQPPSGQ